jgi:hypothetical protein
MSWRRSYAAGNIYNKGSSVGQRAGGTETRSRERFLSLFNPFKPKLV